MNPFFLENRRNDNTAKCANCRWWEGHVDTVSTAKSAKCILNQMVTLDLAACSGWDAYEVLTGRILKPDEIIEE